MSESLLVTPPLTIVTDLAATESTSSGNAIGWVNRVASRDAFPHTSRPLPWVLAGFLGMIFFIPITTTQLKVHLPVDSKIDRFAVIALVLVWIVVGGDQRTFRDSPRSKLYVGAALVFLAIVMYGIFLNSPRIINLGEFQIAQKALPLLFSFFVVSWFALTALRPEDLQGLSSYLIGLGTMVAVGMIVERRLDYNVFYSISTTLLRPIATVGPAFDFNNASVGYDDRVSIIGPTDHPLAATTLLAMVMPFALLRVFDPPSRKSWWINAIAFTLMVSAAFSTERKSGPIAVLVVIAFIGFYHPRKLLRLAPLGVILLGFVHLSSPHSLGTLLSPSQWFDSSSTAHRSGDLDAIWPDIQAHPLLGRGYGTIDITQADQFRILDNQYLSIVWQLGLVGLGAFMWMILAPVVGARRARHSEDPILARNALAASASCVAYFVVNALFDTFTYNQVTYLFMILAAYCTVASGAVTAPEVQQLWHRVRRREAMATA